MLHQQQQQNLNQQFFQPQISTINHESLRQSNLLSRQPSFMSDIDVPSPPNTYESPLHKSSTRNNQVVLNQTFDPTNSPFSTEIAKMQLQILNQNNSKKYHQ
jgi:hypothetical protein